MTDVRYLKVKLRPEETSRQNSSWNIAADFDIDMSLSEDGIRGMPQYYEADHHTGMDTGEMAKLLRDYTGGYPFLVSRLCQMIDGGWQKHGTSRSMVEERHGRGSEKAACGG